jgi:NTE family protein
MGALIGGIHPAGKLAVHTRWVVALQRLELPRLPDLSSDGRGLCRGDRAMAVLRDLIGRFGRRGYGFGRDSAPVWP